MGIIQNSTFQTYFSGRILSTPGFGDVHSGPVTVMKLHDKLNVLMVPAYHNDEMKSNTKRGKET
jgi:hypothetical protein